MKFTEGNPDGPHILELSRRNLVTLLAKLDDALSQRTLADPDWHILVQAVEGEDGHHPLVIKAVENHHHYTERPPGIVYMPSKGVYL